MNGAFDCPYAVPLSPRIVSRAIRFITSGVGLADGTRTIAWPSPPDVVIPPGLRLEVFDGVNRGVVLAVGDGAVEEGLGLNRGIVEPNFRVAPISAFGLTARVGSRAALQIQEAFNEEEFCGKS